MYDYHSRSHSPRSPILARAVGRSSAVSPLPPSWTPPASLPRTGLNASPPSACRCAAYALLRSRREWPRRRAAEQRDELAPLDHSITLSASASSLSGTVRPSALAVFRLMTSSNLAAERRRTSASRPGVAQDHGLDGAHGVSDFRTYRKVV